MRYMLIVDKQPLWGTWKEENQCSPEELAAANLRELYTDEVVLDSENKAHATQVAERLKANSSSFERWDTGSRGEHFHLRIKGLEKLNDADRKLYRLALIRKYGCDEAKQSGVIARENKPHFKTCHPKILIEKWGDKENELDYSLLTKLKAAETLQQRPKTA